MPDIYYTVQGSWPFPLDMLRYDGAKAASPEDQELIDLYSAPAAESRQLMSEKVSIRLVMPDAGYWTPNAGRWMSFGWAALEYIDRVPIVAPAGPAMTTRELAVAIVDMLRGYTMEFSSSPAAHADDYDRVEEVLNERLPVAWMDDGTVRDLPGIPPAVAALKDTHLMEWLKNGHTHCQHGSKEWCQSYLDSARAYIAALEGLLLGKEE